MKIKIDVNYLLILIFSVFLLLPLINNQYFIGHDTGYHIANILAISDNLSYHNIFNLKIFPLIAHNFGYGSGIFYPQLCHICTTIIYKIFSSFNITVFNSIKIFNLLVIFLSGVFMYHFMKVATKNSKLSFVSTLFYMTAPYKIYDYIVRDVLAESLIFVFIPLIFTGVYYILNKDYKKFYLYFVLGYVGLINSHLVMTIYITIFLAIILLTQWKKIGHKEIILRFFLATITVIGITLPFIVPLIEHKFLGSYVVFAKDTMANPYGVYWNGLKFYQYFIGDSHNIGYHFFNIVALGLVIYYLIKLRGIKKIINKIKEDYIFATGFICLILGIWMSSLLFPWVIMPDFLLMIQFPYRLGTMTILGISILSYYAINSFNKNQNKIIILSIVSCIIVALFCMFNQNYLENTLDNYNLTEIGMGLQQEYLSVKTKENIDYFNNRNDEVLVKSGKAEITLLKNITPYLKFNVESSESVTLELPRLYYLGYQIKARYDTSEEEIPYYENENGFIEINLKKGAIIEVDYKGTKLDRISNIISIITFLFLGFYMILIKKRSKKNG